MLHLLKVRTSIDIFSTEKCKVNFGLKYSMPYHQIVCLCAEKIVGIQDLNRGTLV